jgi:hypothetical protein
MASTFTTKGRRFMRLLGICCLAGVLAIGTVACGGGKTDEAKQAAKEAQPVAKEAQEAAKDAGGGAGDVAKGMQEFAKSMEALQKSPDGKAYEPVSFRALLDFLPAVSGWERAEPEGESMTSPVRFSQASASYTKGDASVEVKIVDTAMSRMMTLPYQMFMMSGYSKESTKGYEKAAKIQGQPGWEKWDSESKHAELGVIVGQRFIVTVEGSETDMKAVQDVAGKIDMAKLAALK